MNNQLKSPFPSVRETVLTFVLAEFVEHIVDGLRSDESLSGVENTATKEEVHPASHILTGG